MAPQPDNSLLRAGVVCFLLFCMVMLVGFCSSCSRKQDPITLYHESSKQAASIAANLEAGSKGGEVYEVSDTGSMRPVLIGGDYVVALPTPFKELVVGQVVNYKPAWNNGRVTCHRLVGTWPDGSFIAEGDGPDNTAETQSKVDATNYVDRVISAYRFP